MKEKTKNKTNKIIIIFIIIILLVIIIVWSIIILNNKNQNKIKQNNQTNNIDIFTNTWKIEKVEEELTKEEVESKIDTLKKKLTLKSIIAEWDSFFKEEEYTIALTKYLKILKEIPNDEEIINKIWNIYYILKKYDKAYKYYSQIIDYINLDKNLALNSLLYSFNNKLTKENIEYIKQELNKYSLSDNEYFYYTNSLKCIEDFSLCKENFETYFKQFKQDENLETGTWKILEYENLISINDAIKNYYNFKMDDLSYKNALITWAFFSNWLYPIAIETSKKILSEKTNYKPIIKIIAKSYYELWDYGEAKNFLNQYNEIDDEDAEINYFLWVINQKLHRYVLSSVFLENSIELWYINNIEARRRMIYNYEEMWETYNMLESFKKLIEEWNEKITINDLNLAIFFHFENKKFDEAKKIIDDNIKNENFKDYEYLFDSYLARYYIEQDLKVEENLIEAEKHLKQAIKLNEQDPLVNYLIGIFYFKQNNYDIWKLYLEKTISLDEKWEFWTRAENILNSIN